MCVCWAVCVCVCMPWIKLESIQNYRCTLYNNVQFDFFLYFISFSLLVCAFFRLLPLTKLHRHLVLVQNENESPNWMKRHFDSFCTYRPIYSDAMVFVSHIDYGFIVPTIIFGFYWSHIPFSFHLICRCCCCWQSISLWLSHSISTTLYLFFLVDDAIFEKPGKKGEKNEAK